MKSRTEWITWCWILAGNELIAIAGAIYWTWFEEGELLVTVICWVCIPALAWALWYELGYPARERERQERDAEMFRQTMRSFGLTGDDLRNAMINVALKRLDDITDQDLAETRFPPPED